MMAVLLISQRLHWIYLGGAQDSGDCVRNAASMIQLLASESKRPITPAMRRQFLAWAVSCLRPDRVRE